MGLELEHLLKMITTGVLAAPAEEVEEFFVRNRSAALTQIIDLALLDNNVVATWLEKPTASSALISSYGTWPLRTVMIGLS